MGSRDHSIECETCGKMRGGLNDLECDCDESRNVIASWSPEFIHNLCTDGGETCDDERCWWHVGQPALEQLAANLRDAAMLTKSFNLGDDHGYSCCPCDGPDHDEEYLSHYWRPGCGRAAPGFGGEG